MIFSMTGFGRGCASSPTKKIIIEIKSLNSKQFDFSLRSPSCFRELEVEVRNRLAAELERGKVDVSVTTESLGSDVSAFLNLTALEEYKRQFEQMKEQLGLPEPNDWYSLLLRMPDAMKTEVSQLGDIDRESFWAALKEAAANLMNFRRCEGEKLYRFFITKINNISSLLKEIDPFEAERVPRIRARLEDQLSRLDSIEFERGRLEQELIFYIEKLDVNEEKQRLRSHLAYFLETLGPEDGDVSLGQGKKLGFIAQEMGREINTLGSKSNHAAMQQIVVRMKDELEQIKEQVLNVL